MFCGVSSWLTTYQVPYSLGVMFNSHCSHGSSCIIEVPSETDAILPLVASIIDYNLIPAMESDDLFTNTKYVYVFMIDVFVLHHCRF